ncbi:hypothetical protein BD408DRAFT_461901 [Parasitella parasitica]|nr:hypothetical protein BD408DRAFT_461901 [Parasitella parasitica]
MDWLDQEDIVIQAKEKKISKKNQAEFMSNMETTVDEILKKFPNLTSNTAMQNKTTAPYKHSINKGDAKPIVTRDFRRLPAENAAIAEEVKVMFQKGVTVPSQSNWCSSVILIKKPDGTFRFYVE